MVVAHGVILAAGRGTRLGEITDEIPKPMIQVGTAPVIDGIVHSLAGAGVRRLTVVTGYLAGVIEQHVAARCPVPVGFVRQREPAGTAAALALAQKAIGDEPFFLSWGDVVTSSENYKAVANAWHADLAGVVGVKLLDDVSSGSAVVFGNDKMITAIVEKPAGDPPSKWNNAGVMIFGPQIWSHLKAVQPSKRGELELPDAIGSLVAAEERVEAVPLGGRWHDIGSTSSLRSARESLPEGVHGDEA